MFEKICAEPKRDREAPPVCHRLARPVIRCIGLVLGLAILFGFAPLGLAAPPSEDPANVGRWSEVIQFDPPVVAIHSHLLPTGKVLLWARWPKQPEPEHIDSYLWDPAKAPSGNLEKINNPFANVFCSGHAFLPDGKLLVAGGHDGFDGYGYDGVTFFDPVSQTWSKGPKMNMGRWYPSACTLANGEVLVVSGSGTEDHGTGMNRLPQVWEKQGKWRDLTDARMLMDYYPWMVSAPDGRVFWAGPGEETHFLDPSGTGQWSDGPKSGHELRDYGSAVPYEPGKVLIVGGGGDGKDSPTATAETIDLNAADPKWQKTGSMAFGRRQLNATILPDGKVLVTGGTQASGFSNESGKVLAAEVWDPATGQWTVLASMKVPRLYHSTALLLPDGTVLSAGGGMAGDPPYTNYPNAQIYSPPYLFKGPRPVITSAPQTLSYGASFEVETPDASKIRQVTLVRLGSVTHSFDQSQRFARLTFTATADGLTVTAPSTSKICPPGPYLLFLVNQDGVPSVGRFVSLPAPSAPAAPAASAARPESLPIPDIEVRDQDGRKLRFVSDLLKNRTVVVSFFYTGCKGVCPVTGRALAQLQAALAEAGRDDVSLLSLSRDPETDTPQRLKAWGEKLGVKPGWLLLTSGKQQMDELLLALSGDPAQRGEHSDSLLILDLDRGVWIRDSAFRDPEHYLRVLDDLGKRSLSKGEAMKPREIIIKGMKFHPDPCPIAPGQQVYWKNMEPKKSMKHTAKADDGSFETDILEGQGGTSELFSVSKDTTYKCTLHKGMTGSIVIEK